ncbi:MAG TPA: glycosyltransferase family 9 protein [Pseudolabrys sp.]|nr:glycosyltransferase family 9 protein [Pseudolabrys sp.]
MTRLDLPARPRILVVALRRIGDVLLTTPLIRSIRRAWPDATIDALVFAGSAGILEGNPDLARVIAMPERPTAHESAAVALALWRRYDLAVSSQAGDRPVYFTRLAGRTAVAPVEENLNGRVKAAMLTRSIPVKYGLHRVNEILRLTEALGITPVPQLTAPQQQHAVSAVGGRYAVIHAAPMFRYKQWTIEGWRKLAAALVGRGFRVVATGGPAAVERDYLDALWGAPASPVQRLDGRLSWPALTALLRGAAVFVGPDTSVTHLAAAAGCPTVALFGPTDPRLWGPWPASGLERPWEAAGPVQQRGNVWLVQNVLPCLPCQLEGCERRLDSDSRCLEEMSPTQVIAAVDHALASRDSA